MTGSAEAVRKYDQAIDHLIRFQSEVVDAAAAAVAADPGCVLAKVFCAFLALMSTEESATAGARDALEGLHADDMQTAMLPRERAHVAAAQCWINGDMAGAGELLGSISVEFPRDLLALSVGHQIDFFTGNAVNLRDRIGRAIGGRCGHGRPPGVVRRMQLDGTPVGDRWQPLASGWGRILAPGFYPFNDMHAVMSFIGNGELDRAENLVRALDEVVARPVPGNTGWAMTASIGLPVCRSLVQFGRGEYDSVIADLLPIRTRMHRFGGSHAQRDAVERTLLEAAMRAGRLELASALVSERLSVRERNSYASAQRAWLRDPARDQARAASAIARARELAGQIRAAAG